MGSREREAAAENDTPAVRRERTRRLHNESNRRSRWRGRVPEGSHDPPPPRRRGRKRIPIDEMGNDPRADREERRAAENDDLPGLLRARSNRQKREKRYGVVPPEQS